jgi:CRISPR-associated protein Cmr4
MFENRIFLIENHTNMHVGSGDANFGTVDKLIQRDAVTGYPTVHASSLKGALKEYCEARHDATEAPTFIKQTFGDKDQAGNIRFTDAWLLGVPMRSDTNPYYLCTSPSAIEHFLQIAEVMGVELTHAKGLQAAAAYTKKSIAVAEGRPKIEELQAGADDTVDFTALEHYLGAPVALVPNEQFKELLKDLPVIARNQLENGESKNLWYEEVLPRKSRLFTVVSAPTHLNENDAASLRNHFERLFGYLGDEVPMQIGANASVGYGLCTMTEVGDA